MLKHVGNYIKTEVKTFLIVQKNIPLSMGEHLKSQRKTHKQVWDNLRLWAHGPMGPRTQTIFCWFEMWLF